YIDTSGGHIAQLALVEDYVGFAVGAEIGIGRMQCQAVDRGVAEVLARMHVVPIEVVGERELIAAGPGRRLLSRCHAAQDGEQKSDAKASHVNRHSTPISLALLNRADRLYIQLSRSRGLA